LAARAPLFADHQRGIGQRHIFIVRKGGAEMSLDAVDHGHHPRQLSENTTLVCALAIFEVRLMQPMLIR
jgi:hypothetical protein